MYSGAVGMWGDLGYFQHFSNLGDIDGEKLVTQLKRHILSHFGDSQRS